MPASSAAAPVVPMGTNLVVLRGRIRLTPEFRLLASGEEIVAFDLTVLDADRPRESVPILWQNPPASAAKLSQDDEVVVVGRVRRRFFRAGGATASRTEVHADLVVGARAAARVRSVLVPRFEHLNLW